MRGFGILKHKFDKETSMSDSVSRRSFVRTAAISAAPALLPRLSAAGEITMGFIGTGGRGNYLMQRLHAGAAARVKVLGVCDTYQGHLNRAKDMVQSEWKNTPQAVVDYKDILSNRDIQVVVIATPEHLHHRMTLDAIAAGKHIYIEKPLAHTIEEGEEILAAARKSPNVKIQVGTQNRSNSLYTMARQLVEQGMIGECHYVRAFWYRSALANGAPAWRYNIPADTSEQNTDWARFLGPAPKRSFDKQRYFQWRLYSDYSSGISTDLLVHQTDISNFVMKKSVPASCMASGGVYRWTDPGDDRDVADTISAVYEYADKFHINYSCYFGNDHYGYGEQFMGNDGTIEVLNRQFLNFYPQGFAGKPPARVAGRKEMSVHLPGNDNLAVEAHLRNLLDAIERGAPLVAPVEVGQEAAISGHMATLSLANRKMVVWDDKARKHSFV
jgi:predicted dehydrogenase